MPGFDALAPDQKAVLQLLLKQGKTYDDIAGLLRLDRANVRERALDALDALGADGPGATGSADALSSERQDEVGDHLLLQQTASERAATRRFLESSVPGRAWARKVAAELGPIAGEELPDVPAEPAEVAEAFDALDERTAARERQEKSSKLGGVLVLLAIGAVIAVGILWFVRAGDDEPARTAVTPTTTAGPTGATGPVALPRQAINLQPPSGGPSSKALGYSVIDGGVLAFQVEGLRQSDFYDVWLYNSPSDALFLGFANYDRRTKRLAGQSQPLPVEAGNYESLVITRQTTKKPTAPGTIVLQGGPIKRS